MPDPPLPRTLLALALLLFLTVPARADIIHLTNGGSIHADSWEQAGDELIIHQGSGTIVIPRAEVERIEATGESAQPAPGTPTY